MSTRFAPLGLALAAALLAHAGAQAAVTSVRAAPPPSSAAEALAQEAPGTARATPQHSKMKACNADAKLKDLHGEERRKFMSQCLSGKPAAQRS
jgi:hypothetical protein